MERRYGGGEKWWKVHGRCEYREFTEDPMPEELIWHIFECLAMAAHVMEHGTEEIGGKSWETSRRLVHSDIKPDDSTSINPLLPLKT